MTKLDITGMTCESCVARVKHAPEQVHGVHAAEVSYAQGNARVALDAGVSADASIAAVTGLGYRARLADTPSPGIFRSPFAHSARRRATCNA